MATHDEAGALDVAGGWLGLGSLLLLWVFVNFVLLSGGGRPEAFSFVTFNFVIAPALFVLGFILTFLLLLRKLRMAEQKGAFWALVRLVVLGAAVYAIISGNITYMFMPFGKGP